MKTLKTWLDEGRGRYTALASHLGVSVGRISQMAKDGVPPKDMLAVRDFTDGAVSLEAMVAARTPGADDKPSPAPSAAPVASSRNPKHREAPSRHKGDKPSNNKGR